MNIIRGSPVIIASRSVPPVQGWPPQYLQCAALVAAAASRDSRKADSSKQSAHKWLEVLIPSTMVVV
jgi:hypothetical protein